MYKKLVQKLIEAQSEKDLCIAGGEINKAFETEKISWKDHEQLYELLGKLSKLYR